ncbi:Hypothetical protein (Fragment) [Durusdinium trenchii]|uniref:Glycosyl transferase family 1 domain-containing protein n=1 Tax=Durusdinium trenchii TaxID=1381693 RepID=A0ABP0HMV2_9DINO
MAHAERRETWPRQRGRLAQRLRHWRPSWRVWRHVDAFPGENLQTFRLPLGFKTPKALQLCKHHCHGDSGFVLGLGPLGRCGVAYVRPKAPAELLEKRRALKGSWLCVRSKVPMDPKVMGNCRTLVVIASQDEFKETSYFDPHVDVSSSGNGRKLATHALLRNVLEGARSGWTLMVLLILDFQAPLEEGSSKLQTAFELSIEGPELLQVQVQGYGLVEAWRGDLEQLLVAVAGDLRCEVALSTSLRRDMLTLLHAVTAQTHVAMGHDYNLPIGPWGVREASSELHDSHVELLRRTRLCCTSQHLAEYVTRWSEGQVETRLCYSADYGYFDRFSNSESSTGQLVTFISPCPAKGLAIFLRVAHQLPSLRFLAVTTLWTKSIHVEALRKLPNVEILPGRTSVEDIYRRTAVLLVPSIWSEAFGLVAVEAQLLGIPVVSSDHYGLREANFCEELRVSVRLVQDLRIRTLHRGAIDELEHTLSPTRHEPPPSEERMRDLAESHLYIATEEEAAGFTHRVESLMKDVTRRKAKGEEAKRRAESFVQARSGAFWRILEELASKKVSPWTSTWQHKVVLNQEIHSDSRTWLRGWHALVDYNLLFANSTSCVSLILSVV